MPATDDEILKKQQSLERLRQTVLDEESKRDTLLRETHNDINVALMDAEEERLKERLAAAKDATKAARESTREAVKAAKAGPVEAEPTQDGAAVTPTGETPKSEKE